MQKPLAVVVGLLLLASSALAGAGSGGTTLDETMVWDGITRYYEVFLPDNLPANPPMLLMLHGTHYAVPPKTPITKDWGWQPIATQYGFILVQPASTYDPQSGQWNWNAYYMDNAFPQPPPDDSGFLRQLITNLTTQYNVNQNQIYVTGFSSGAQMAHRVGVEISDLVAAISPVSGTIVGQQSPPPIQLPGQPLAPISVQEWHGTDDGGIPPCNHGRTKYSGVSFYLATVDESFDYWWQQDGCTQLQNDQPLCLDDKPNPNSTGNIATGCTNNTEVQFIWEEGVGHEWLPQNAPDIWLFFAANPKQL